jgi:hypothetical protein
MFSQLSTIRRVVVELALRRIDVVKLRADHRPELMPSEVKTRIVGLAVDLAL